MSFLHFNQYGGLLQKRFQILRPTPNSFDKKEGVYIISQGSNPTVQMNSRMKVKIGYSNNLYGRLDSYHTSYPDSFYTYSVIITKDKSAKKIEKAIHDELVNSFRVSYQYLNKEYQARWSGEWFYLRKKRLLQVLNRVIEKYQKDIVMLWNDNVGDNIENGFELKAPENNTAIKVKNTWETTYNRGRRQESAAVVEPLPEGIAPPAPPPAPRPRRTKAGYAVTREGQFETVPTAPQTSWEKDWNPADTTLTRASRRKPVSYKE